MPGLLISARAFDMFSAPLASVPLGLLFGGGIGVPEMLLFGGIVLVLFGKRLPGAMRSLGQSVGALKQGLHESEAMGEDAASNADSSTRTPTAA
ncbi:MAG: twin-arginine translocase TatA/TatE family subunit [Planctomycetota bacterium]